MEHTGLHCLGRAGIDGDILVKDPELVEELRAFCCEIGKLGFALFRHRHLRTIDQAETGVFRYSYSKPTFTPMPQPSAFTQRTRPDNRAD